MNEFNLPLRLNTKVSREDFKQGDVFLWKSQMNGNYEIHTFHSNAGYGVKTFTDYNNETGRSTLVNWLGVCGIIEATE